MNTKILERMCALDSRIADGIHVRLLSGEDEGVVVSVDDSKTGDSFGIEVRSDERAVDVFHHPFAYAAYRGIELGVRTIEPTTAFG